jgi:hypothetical protein
VNRKESSKALLRDTLVREPVAAHSMREEDPLLFVTVPSKSGAPVREGALAQEPGAASGDAGDADEEAAAALRGPGSVAPYSLFLDLYRGAVPGAYAVDDLHTPGLLVWILTGFVPGVGTVAALRDGYYSLEVREWGAFLLNVLGLVPFVKGFANIAQVASLHRLRHTAHVTHQVAHVARRASRSVQRSATVATGSAHAGGAVVLVLGHESGPRQNAWAWPAALLSLITFAVAPLYLVAALLLVGGQRLLAVPAPLPIVVSGATAPLVWCLLVLALAQRARGIARQMRGRPFARPGVSSLAFWLGLCALLLTALAGAAVVLVALPLAQR